MKAAVFIRLCEIQFASEQGTSKQATDRSLKPGAFEILGASVTGQFFSERQQQRTLPICLELPSLDLFDPAVFRAHGDWGSLKIISSRISSSRQGISISRHQLLIARFF
jgi:hypothetical protein